MSDGFLSDAALEVLKRTASEGAVFHVAGGRGFIGSGLVRILDELDLPWTVATSLDARLERRIEIRPSDVVLDADGNSRKYLAELDPAGEPLRSLAPVVERLAHAPRAYVLVSSAEVYEGGRGRLRAGEAGKAALRGRGEVLDPLRMSVYAAVKHAAESVVARCAPRWVIARGGGFAGPGLCKGPLYDLLHGERIRVGRESRFFCLGTDRAAAWLLEALSRLLARGEERGILLDLTSRDTVPLELIARAAASWYEARGITAPEPQWSADAPPYRPPLEEAVGEEAAEFPPLEGAPPVTRPAAADELERFLLRWRGPAGRTPLVVLAGGLGTRLRSVTDVPKPAVEVDGTPMAFLAALPAVRGGAVQVVFSLGWRADAVRRALEAAAVEHGGEARTRFAFVEEPSPLGTGGALLRCVLERPELLEHPEIVVCNGDTLWTGSPAELVRLHRRMEADVTLALSVVEEAEACGTVELDERLRVRRFLEKGRCGRAAVYAGVAVFESAVLSGAARRWDGTPFSLERQMLPSLLEKGARVVGAPGSWRFIDMGTPEGLEAAHRFVDEWYEATCRGGAGA